MHSDNEKCIEASSQIITVSFGANRTIKFRSTVGHPTEVEHVIPNGSVYLMSAESQSIWKHGFSREPEIKDVNIAHIPEDALWNTFVTRYKAPCSAYQSGH